MPAGERGGCHNSRGARDGMVLIGLWRSRPATDPLCPEAKVASDLGKEAAIALARRASSSLGGQDMHNIGGP